MARSTQTAAAVNPVTVSAFVVFNANTLPGAANGDAASRPSASTRFAPPSFTSPVELPSSNGVLTTPLPPIPPLPAHVVPVRAPGTATPGAVSPTVAAITPFTVSGLVEFRAKACPDASNGDVALTPSASIKFAPPSTYYR